jgi:hypothetical protein
VNGECRSQDGARGSLGTWERRFQHAAFLLVAVSGILLAWWKDLSPVADDPFRAVSHPLQPLSLHAHVLAAPLLLVGLGLILRDHILARLRRRVLRSGWWSGALATVLLAPLIASGYLLQTATDEAFRRFLVWVHLGTGALYVAAFVAHAAASRWTSRGSARLRAGVRLARSPENVELRAAPPRAGSSLTP